MILPWQQSTWEALTRLQTENRLPHALLFAGPEGVGKRILAKAFAQHVLCEKKSICGKCHACHLVEAGSHPDFNWVEPEAEGGAIKIDQIRELSEFIQNTSHQGGFRVVVIEPATAMNTYSANALLKTLEEPTPNTLLILITDERTALPITIVSRCQKIHFAAPKRDEALAWLQLSAANVDWPAILDATQGAPLLAKQWHEQGVWPQYQHFMQDLAALSQRTANPLQLAVQWKEANLLWVFDLFFEWLLKLMRMKQVGIEDRSFAVQQVAENIPTSSLLAFASYLQRLRADSLGPYNLNQQLLLESLFIRWAQYVSS